jgi:hypothetical protein
MSRDVAKTHSLRRTSPFGELFVGFCTLCGKEGLTTADMNKPCENPLSLTEDEAVVLAIQGGRADVPDHSSPLPTVEGEGRS